MEQHVSRDRRLAATLARRHSPEWRQGASELEASRRQAEEQRMFEARRTAAPNHRVTRDLRDRIDDGILDATGDNPDVCEDDIAHDVALSICSMDYRQHPAEVDWIWQGMFGETFTARLRYTTSL